MAIKLPVQNDDEDVVDTTATLEPVLISSSSKERHWWYRPLLTLVWAAVVIGILCGIAYAVSWGYVRYTSWYDAQLARSFATGQVYGLAKGVQQGRSAQQSDDVKSFAQVLTKVKATDAKDLQKAKLTSYTTGKQDAVNSLLVWWAQHCRFDSVISSYVCNGSP